MSEINTPQDFFARVLPLRFKPEKAKDIEVIVQTSITGLHSGDWIVEIKDQKLVVQKGKHPSAKLTIIVSEADFLDIVNDKLSAQKAFFLGKIKFKGDIALALKLRDAGFL